MQERVVVVARDEIAIVSPLGEHDACTADVFRDALDRHAHQGFGVLVDLARTEYIDSAILGVVLTTWRECQADGRRFGVVLPPDASTFIHRLMDTSGLRPVLPLYDDLEWAIAQLDADEPHQLTG
jgi:anti-anti-sigma factor